MSQRKEGGARLWSRLGRPRRKVCSSGGLCESGRLEDQPTTGAWEPGEKRGDGASQQPELEDARTALSDRNP